MSEKKKELLTGEWSPEQWQSAWNIQVGRAYGCKACGTVIMVSKGGVGNLEPICCKQPMQPLGRSGAAEGEGTP